VILTDEVPPNASSSLQPEKKEIKNINIVLKSKNLMYNTRYNKLTVAGRCFYNTFSNRIPIFWNFNYNTWMKHTLKKKTV
jgi:hypothetical protein